MEIQQAISKLKMFYRSHKRLPSYSEMTKLFGFSSKNAAFKLMKKLIAMEIVEKDQTGHILPKSFSTPLPFLGAIKAGRPTMSEGQINETLSLEEYLLSHPESSFFVRVSGDSMTGAGINPDDLVIVETKRQPRNGDIVAALVDDEWTLKYYQAKNGQITLVPANPKYQEIHPAKSLVIGGVVISVIRKYH